MMWVSFTAAAFAASDEVKGKFQVLVLLFRLNFRLLIGILLNFVLSMCVWEIWCQDSELTYMHKPWPKHTWICDDFFDNTHFRIWRCGNAGKRKTRCQFHRLLISLYIYVHVPFFGHVSHRTFIVHAIHGWCVCAYVCICCFLFSVVRYLRFVYNTTIACF